MGWYLAHRGACVLHLLPDFPSLRYRSPFHVVAPETSHPTRQVWISYVQDLIWEHVCICYFISLICLWCIYTLSINSVYTYVINILLYCCISGIVNPLQSPHHTSRKPPGNLILNLTNQVWQDFNFPNKYSKLRKSWSCVKIPPQQQILANWGP